MTPSDKELFEKATLIDATWPTRIDFSSKDEEQEPCKWTLLDDECDFGSGCGNIWRFDWGGPNEAGWIYCPYCGKPIQEVDA